MLPLLSLLVPTFAPLAAGPGPVSNPLKGYAPYVPGGDYAGVPTTMSFYETSWRELEPKESEFRFAEWEAKTVHSPVSKDKRIVLRVWIDYPNQALGIPQWLVDEGVKLSPYDDAGIGKGQSPDYANPRFRSALQRLIRAMGARWNRDPQVAYVQLGLLGHWGEWHTYPRNDLWAPRAVQRETIDAMHAAFPDKQLMGRTASDDLGKQAWLGYHDDMIPQDTLGTDKWNFWPGIKAAGRADNWKVAPTGGEMVPGAAVRYLGPEWPLTQEAVREAHLSWIGPYAPTMVDSQDPAFRARAAELSQKLGYEFRLTGMAIDDGRIYLEGVNQGVAPFYYRWPVRFAVLDAKGAVLATSEATADVRTWLPGNFFVEAPLPKLTSYAGTHLAVGLIDPWVDRPTVRFANRLSTVDGWTIVSSLSLSHRKMP